MDGVGNLCLQIVTVLPQAVHIRCGYRRGEIGGL